MGEVPWPSLVSASLSSDNDARSEAHRFITTLRESDLDQYLGSILLFVDQCDSDVAISFTLSLILSELRQNDNITSPLFDPFWHSFFELLTRHPFADPRSLHFISQILAALAERTQTVDVLSFLLEFLSVSPDSVLPLLSAVVERTNAFVPLDSIMAFLASESPSDVIYGAKVQLLFSLLRKNPKDPAVCALFDDLLTPMPSGFTAVFLHLFFAQLKQIEGALTEFIFKIYGFLEWSLSVHPVLSMLCLARFTCLDNLKSNVEAIANFFRIILPVLGAFSDDEESLYFVARFCVNYVSRKGDPFSFISVFSSLALPVIPLLSCLCEFDATLRLRLVQQTHVWCEVILRHSLDSDCSIRVLALNALAAFCRDLGPMFQEDCLDELFELFCRGLQTFLLVPQTEVAFYDTLTAFFSKLRFEDSDERCLALFEAIFPNFHESRLKMEIADCVCAMIEAMPNGIRPHFTDMLRYLEGQMESALPVLKISGVIARFIHANHGQLLPFWQASLQIRQRLKTGFEIEICDSVICTLTCSLKSQLVGELGPLMADLLSGASQQIVVSVFDQATGIDRVAGFELVLSIHEDKLVFVSETSVTDISSFLKIIQVCAKEFGNQYFIEFGEATLTLCSQFILLPYHVAVIKQIAWDIVNTLSETANISSFIILHFLQSITGTLKNDY
jgi:hypothetical protein